MWISCGCTVKVSVEVVVEPSSKQVNMTLKKWCPLFNRRMNGRVRGLRMKNGQVAVDSSSPDTVCSFATKYCGIALMRCRPLFLVCITLLLCGLTIDRHAWKRIS